MKNHLKTIFCLGLTITTLLLLAGCDTRSISDSGYHPRDAYSGERSSVRELNEFEVLGVDRDLPISEADITKTLDDSAKIKLHRNSPTLVVQSGALFPDEPMVTELGHYLSVVPFSGLPGGLENSDKPEKSPSSYGKFLRLTAARGGCENIICYWGILETAQQNFATKTISWVPIAGYMVPDEKQTMRIRLKLAIIDVRTGHWSLFTPEPLTDKAISALVTRERRDQQQVELLKQKAYEAAAKDVIRLYGN